ncbi:MAG: hypothetical protein U1F16_02165 [Turneriella sp.]
MREFFARTGKFPREMSTNDPCVYCIEDAISFMRSVGLELGARIRFLFTKDCYDIGFPFGGV